LTINTGNFTVAQTCSLIKQAMTLL
jgi:hypothetical protein